MNKELLKEISRDFDESKEGKEKNKVFRRIHIYGILCILLGIIYIIDNIFNHTNGYSYIFPIILILFGIYFIIKQYIIKKDTVVLYNYNKKYHKAKKK